ncbi:hypothetical protein [Clostridium butyricum]|uniref:hypothetical protein n=1 Tax=Clostridium butyricum TaxID=1492 RepID=UPI0022DF09DF|nr:hypothetical protein [Clostridium butyricum]
MLKRQEFVNSAINNGFDPKTAEIYGNMAGDFSEGMLFETGFTIVGKGLKAASALKSGEVLSEGEIVAGSGVGNLKGTKTSYVKSSEISEKAIKSIKKKWGQKGVDAFEKAMNKGIVGAEGQNGIKPLKGKPYKGKYTHEIKVKNKEYGDFRIYGYKDSSGKMIFECFDKGLH